MKFVGKAKNVLLNEFSSVYLRLKRKNMISLLDLEQYSVKLKATIQQTGRLGFTAETAKAFGLTPQMHVQFARDDEGDRALYMVLREGQVDNSFRVMKAGQYFYLPTKQMFDLAPIASLDAQFGGKVYKMVRRELDRNKQKESEENMEK